MTTDQGPTTGPEGLFRPEALAHRARKRGEGDVIRVAPRWTSWAFYLLVALFAAALGVGMTVEVDRHAEGPATIDDRGRVVVLLPSALAPEVDEGSPVELGGASAEVVSYGDEVLYPDEVRERFGITAAQPSIAVVTSASTDTGGIARVLIEREPVLIALIPGLKAIFGN